MGILTDRPELNAAPALDDVVHIVDISDATDNPGGTSKKITIANLKKLVHNAGFLDYNDDATSTTPIVVTLATSPVLMTNDEAGAFTNKSFAPVGVTDVWDALNDTFDWSELSIGDMVDIRVDLVVTTTQPNQDIDLELRLAAGAFEYTIPFRIDSFKTAGEQRIVAYNGIYMGDANTLDNGAYFEVSSDANCTVVVNGWYCKIIKK